MAILAAQVMQDRERELAAAAGTPGQVDLAGILRSINEQLAALEARIGRLETRGPASDVPPAPPSGAGGGR